VDKKDSKPTQCCKYTRNFTVQKQNKKTQSIYLELYSGGGAQVRAGPSQCTQPLCVSLKHLKKPQL